MTRYARRRDGNHGEIVRAFEQLGCSVAQLDKAGKAGWPDLAIGCLGITRLCEIKNPETRYGRQGLNEGQEAFAASWRGSEVHVVDSVGEVARLVARWRSDAV